MNILRCCDFDDLLWRSIFRVVEDLSEDSDIYSDLKDTTEPELSRRAVNDKVTSLEDVS